MQENKIQAQEYIPTRTEGALDPLGDGISSLALIRVSGSDLDVVNAARVSYGKVSTQLTDRDRNLIKFLMEHGHSSPFEHNQLSFRVKAPLYVTKQWMRHRMNSYNEISLRYVKAPVEFYIPNYWRSPDKDNRQVSTGRFDSSELTQAYKNLLEVSYKTYEQLLEAGVCREQARGVLPTCTYSEFIFTCNLHSLMHFMKLRCGKDSQKEIQAYAFGLLQLAEPHFSFSISEWKKVHLTQAYPKLV